jgi:hypothetical protein
MKQFPTSHLREQTVLYWANFVHARSPVDVKRVHSFQTLMRDLNGDLSKLTDADVSLAYGGKGWVPAPSCWECGVREDTNITFGEPTGNGELFCLCVTCLDTAQKLNQPVEPPPKKSFFSRLKGN